ncbi:acyl-CoA N-acyltransferase, partial [Pluteus cervinus]
MVGLELKRHRTSPISYGCYLLVGAGLCLSLLPTVCSTSYPTSFSWVRRLFLFASRQRTLLQVVGSSVSLAVSALWLGYRWDFRRMSEDFCKAALQTDLKDIAAHYQSIPMRDEKENGHLSTSPAGFWVAELVDERELKAPEIVAFVGLDYSASPQGYQAELKRMTVSPKYQRRGIGSKLVNTVITHARSNGITSIGLATTAWQPAAVALYEKFGWKLVR